MNYRTKLNQHLSIYPTLCRLHRLLKILDMLYESSWLAACLPTTEQNLNLEEKASIFKHTCKYAGSKWAWLKEWVTSDTNNWTCTCRQVALSLLLHPSNMYTYATKTKGCMAMKVNKESHPNISHHILPEYNLLAV